MGDSRFRLHAPRNLSTLRSAVLGATALSVVLPYSAAHATCAATGETATVISVGCIGATAGALPISTLPSPPLITQTSGALVLGADGNVASITNTSTSAVNLTATGAAGNFLSLDTGNIGAPSSIVGATNGVSLATTGGADILIGQSSAGGAGLNANITGQNGAGILANTSAGGNIAISIGPGTTVTGQNGFGISAIATGAGNVSLTTGAGSSVVSQTSNAIFVQVQNGNANLILNGNASNTSFTGYSVGVASTGTGAINIGGSGNSSQGIIGFSSGTGGITIGGTGSIVNTLAGAAPNGLLTAEIANAANPSDITITRSGAVSVLAGQAGVFASTAGPGNIFITGTGNVTAGLAGITAAASGGNVTIAPQGSVTGANGIVASTTLAGNINITTLGAITGTAGYGIQTSVATGTSTVNVGAGSVVSGSSGPLNPTGTTIVNNAGTLNFANGLITTTNLNTPANSTTLNGQGGRLAIDVNTAAGTADLLNVTKLTGATGIQVQPIGALGLISTPIPILSATALAPGTTVSAINTPGVVNYTVQQSGNTFDLVSKVNTSIASATPTGLNALITAINTGFFQNASAFISEPPNPEKNQWNGGLWIRVADGQNDVSSQTAAQNPTGTTTAPAKVRTDFNGFQTGVDLGLANVEGSGWNTHLGVTAGEVNLQISDLLATTISSQVEVPFIGVYGAVTGHNFFGDFQVREDLYGMNITNPTANLTGSPLSGAALSFNLSAGYRYDLPSSWFVEPSLAFLYSDLHVNALRVGLNSTGTDFGTLVFNPFLSELGRAGFRIGTTYIVESAGLAVQPFGTASIWHEFAPTSESTLDIGPSAIPLTDTRVGTFGQLGLGVSAQVLKTGFLGFVRGDYRFGDNISGYAVVAGLRYQF